MTKRIDNLSKIQNLIFELLIEKREILSQLEDTNAMTNLYWLYRNVEEAKLRLNTIEIELRGCIDIQAEQMQKMQQETINLIKIETRHYAKRQMTWFKKDPEIVWFNPENKDQIIRYLNDNL